MYAEARRDSEVDDESSGFKFTEPSRHKHLNIWLLMRFVKMVHFKLKPYKAPRTSSEFDKINQIGDIFEHPGYPEQPLLLLFQLSPQAHSDEYKALERIIKCKSFTTLFGPSGCGKTRLLLESLIHNHVYYFIGTGRSMGSADVMHIHTRLSEVFRSNLDLTC